MQVAIAPPETPAEARTPQAGRALRTLRAILRREYLTEATRPALIMDMATMAQTGLEADSAAVALWSSEKRWEVYTEGVRLNETELSQRLSRSLLELARDTGRTVSEDFTTAPSRMSASVVALGILHAICAPLYRWEVEGQEIHRVFAGCLYADRRWHKPFTEDDRELALDIAEIASRALNLVGQLLTTRRELDEARARGRTLAELVTSLQEEANRRYALGAVTSLDDHFGQAVMNLLRQVSVNPRVAILAFGRPGSGKNHLLRAYHAACPRHARPLVSVDCAAIRGDILLASHLFGYAAQSGLPSAPPEGTQGAIAAAEGGTLLLENVDAAPATVQVRLLQLLDEGKYLPLGSVTERAADVQVLSTTTLTTAEFAEKLRRGAFNDGLYYRLAEIVIAVPELTARAADVPALAKHFLQEYRRALRFSTAALEALAGHDWSRVGNLRGLERTIRRTVYLLPAAVQQIEVAHIAWEHRPGEPAPATPAPPPVAKRVQMRHNLTLELVVNAIKQYGSLPAAARALNAPRDAVYYYLRKNGLSVATVKGRQPRRLPRPSKMDHVSLEEIRQAVREAGSLLGAAKKLGFHRNLVALRLQREGLTAKQLLDGTA